MALGKKKRKNYVPVRVAVAPGKGAVLLLCAFNGIWERKKKGPGGEKGPVAVRAVKAPGEGNVLVVHIQWHACSEDGPLTVREVKHLEERQSSFCTLKEGNLLVVHMY